MVKIRSVGNAITKERAFQVSKISKKKYSKIIRKSKRRIEDRLGKRQWKDQREPIMKGSNIHYEMSEKAQAISCGGIGVFHQMVKRIGLEKEINANLKLLKVHPTFRMSRIVNLEFIFFILQEVIFLLSLYQSLIFSSF